MNLDLDNILRDWPYEPGQVKVRKITGAGGEEKLQVRLDLGVIQMNLSGRPDGQRPHGCESLLAHLKQQATAAGEAGERYALTEQDCGDLQQEGIQYYHRYVGLFQLGDFQGVVRDTQRNLDLFAFVSAHAERPELAEQFEQFRPYVLMMNTRARACLDLEHHDFPAALRQIARGRRKIVEAYGGEDQAGSSLEISFLDEWTEELKRERPLSKLEQLEREMQRAIAMEAYERAAELRDAIRAHRSQQ
jgi:hypothetical protein